MAASERMSFASAIGPNYDNKDPGFVDLSNQSLNKLDPTFVYPTETHTLILDGNNIIKLEHLEKNKALRRLSVSSNHLVRMMGVSKLTQLRFLNLPNNSIGHIEGLKELVSLEWLNLSGNNIKEIERLNHCVSLQHLDLSDNNVSHIGDLTNLRALKTLLLKGNVLTTLRSAPDHLPVNLTVLSLAENEIRDLTEVSYLAALPGLEHLSLTSNPCVLTSPSLLGCDYRSYVASCCARLKVLDGHAISETERQRPSRPPQHHGDVKLRKEDEALITHTSPKSDVNLGVRVNYWMDAVASSTLPGAEDSLVLQDIQTDQERSNISLASSDWFNSASGLASEPDTGAEEFEDSLALPESGQNNPPEEHWAKSDEAHSDSDQLSDADGRACCAVSDDRWDAAVRIQAWWRGHWTRHYHTQARSVRNEIRLRRMQDHIVHLTTELERLKQQQQEEQLQRRVQEESVKFLWKQLQVLMEWQSSVMASPSVPPRVSTASSSPQSSYDPSVLQDISAQSSLFNLPEHRALLDH